MGNASLGPWLELADEPEQFVQFMHASLLVPRRTTASGVVAQRPGATWRNGRGKSL